jgi:hypothetical protein
MATVVVKADQLKHRLLALLLAAAAAAGDVAAV